MDVGDLCWFSFLLLSRDQRTVIFHSLASIVGVGHWGGCTAVLQTLLFKSLGQSRNAKGLNSATGNPSKNICSSHVAIQAREMNLEWKHHVMDLREALPAMSRAVRKLGFQLQRCLL